jgi:hypothetical protein
MIINAFNADDHDDADKPLIPNFSCQTTPNIPDVH